MKFRTDINGLRALAVIAVTLFHFNETLLPGGFIGVDVFFVISGFLMTKIIINGLDNNSFSLNTFYTSRANRIIPPLAALCLFLLVFGWFFLTPTDYRQVGNDVLNSMLFISNFIYAQEKGYFDTSSSEEWLLHTWSLSVEWQFYLIYPLLLLGIYRLLGQDKTKVFIVAATFVSFIICIVWGNIAPTSSYFLLPTRAWEMLIGGVAFLYPLSSKKNNTLLTYLGITIIVVSAIFINNTYLWPSYLTLLPIFGTYLIIISNQKNIILDNRIIQHIGSWSYSIYLWHWGVLVIGDYLDLNHLFYLGIFSSVALGFISYKLIEKKDIKYNPFVVVITVSLLGGIIHKTDGALFHYSEKIKQIHQNNTHSTSNCDILKNDGCKYINGNKIKNNGLADYILIGDSHAESQLQSILPAIPNNKSLLYLSSAGCLFTPNLYSKYRETSNCDDSIAKVYNTILKNNKNSHLIFVQRTNIYFNGYNNHEGENKYKDIRYSSHRTKNTEEIYIDTLCNLNKFQSVTVTEPTPEQLVDVPNYQIKSLLLNKNEDLSLPKDVFLERNLLSQKLNKQLKSCGVEILKPSKYLCDNNHCPIIINEHSIYRDDDHLSLFGSSLLIPMYKKAFNFIEKE